jgi:hypothetical protein
VEDLLSTPGLFFFCKGDTFGHMSPVERLAFASLVLYSDRRSLVKG